LIVKEDLKLNQLKKIELIKKDNNSKKNKKLKNKQDKIKNFQMGKVVNLKENNKNLKGHITQLIMTIYP